MEITTTVNHGRFGRLGNQIIRNLAVSLIAEKYDLKVVYGIEHLMNKLGIILFSGNNVYNTTKKLTDDNYFTIYNSGSLTYNLCPNESFFQTKEIINFIYEYLHTDQIKSGVIEKNPFKERYNRNNDLLVHIRLTDVAKHNPGVNYYLNAIKHIKFDNLFITTDDKTHSIVKTICKTYPQATIIDYDEIYTFQFASTCKYIILSHGTFSSVIGYLSFFSTIYYPEYESDKIWYGDVFSIKNWIKLNIN